MAYPGNTTYPGTALLPGGEEEQNMVPEYCWPIVYGCVDPATLADIPTDVRARSESLAVSTLRALTLYQVGGCARTVRPCAAGCAMPTLTISTFTPTLNYSGDWVNVACGCGRAADCSCGALHVVLLATPVGRVDRVVIDGVELDPSAYRVDNGRELVRTDGDPWPICQDMSAAVGEEGTFAVTYLNAYPVDDLGAYAAGRLAYEYMKACMGGNCSLPSGVTEISRQGITMQIRLDMFEGGLTGLREVDDWTARYNPHRLRRKPAVYTPDLRGHRHTLGG